MFNSFGNIFRLTSFGESHGKGVGGVIDGFPSGITIDEEFVQQELNRRRPGQSILTTPRKEADKVEFLSGIFEGKSTGCPIGFIVWNENQHSNDYNNLKEVYRPSHADYTYKVKYGIRDHRGGGRSSARETIGRVAAGAIAAKLLKEMGIFILTYTKSIGPVSIDPGRFDAAQISQNPVAMPDAQAAKEAQFFLDQCIEAQDSSGGIIECVIDGVPAGIGDPVFDKLDASLAKAIFSIGAVKGFEVGDGFAAATARGSENNDSFVPQENGPLTKTTNHAGGILGGISDGSPIVFRAAVKPTPSIAQLQHTANADGEAVDIRIRGRHDPVVVPRAVVVVESMAAITILDLMLRNTTAKLDNLKKIYE